MKFKLLITLSMATLLFGCASPLRLENYQTDLLIEKEQFSFKIAFISENQPEPLSPFINKKWLISSMTRTLKEKGYEVVDSPISITTFKAKSAGEGLLVECSRNLDFHTDSPLTISCGAYDLYDGKKVFESSVSHTLLPFSDYSQIEHEGFRLALKNLPEINVGRGKIISEADAFSKLQ